MRPAVRAWAEATHTPLHRKRSDANRRDWFGYTSPPTRSRPHAVAHARNIRALAPHLQWPGL